MRFMVEEKVFEALPDMCVGVVVAKGADNSVENAARESQTSMVCFFFHRSVNAPAKMLMRT